MQSLLEIQNLRKSYSRATSLLSGNSRGLKRKASGPKSGPELQSEFVEVGAVEQILHRPEHSYTRELLAAVPELPKA